MLSLVQAHSAYLAAARAALRQPGQFDATRAEHVRQLGRALGSLPSQAVTLEDGTAALKHLQGSCFTDDEQATLSTIIAGIMAPAIASEPSATTSAGVREVVKPQEPNQTDRSRA